MYGAIDIGSNTIRLSVYEVEDNSLTALFHKKAVVGLASLVDAKGNLSQKGIRKTIEALDEFRSILDSVVIEEVYPFATASLRNIRNTDEAVAAIEEKSGMKIRVLTGEEEALFAYSGATLFAPLAEGILVDIGGGSSEFVFYKDHEIKNMFSIPLGSLNLYSKFVTGLLPDEQEMKKIRDKVTEALSAAAGNAGELIDAKIICGVGGTIRGTGKLMKELFGPSGGLSSRYVEVRRIRDFLATAKEDRQYTLQKIIQVVPDRIHTMIPGMLLLDTAAAMFGGEMIAVSEFGVREGYLYHMLTDNGVIHV